MSFYPYVPQETITHYDRQRAANMVELIYVPPEYRRGSSHAEAVARAMGTPHEHHSYAPRYDPNPDWGVRPDVYDDPDTSQGSSGGYDGSSISYNHSV